MSPIHLQPISHSVSSSTLSVGLFICVSHSSPTNLSLCLQFHSVCRVVYLSMSPIHLQPISHSVPSSTLSVGLFICVSHSSPTNLSLCLQFHSVCRVVYLCLPFISNQSLTLSQVPLCLSGCLSVSPIHLQPISHSVPSSTLSVGLFICVSHSSPTNLSLCPKFHSVCRVVYLCLPFISNHSLTLDRLVGLVVKASASRAEGPGFESRSRRDFFGVESYQ